MGKRTELNKKVNRKIKAVFEQTNIRSCEIGLPKCQGTGWLTWAHRHKRNDYLGQDEMLWNFNQVVLACINCHQTIEQDKDLTEKMFMKLRGDDQLEGN